jgi:hypothetical protein
MLPATSPMQRTMSSTNNLLVPAADQPQSISAPRRVARSHWANWLIHDSPFIGMLLLALAGVTLRLAVIYWVILMPVFGVISVVAGWPHVATRRARIELIVALALCWAALLLSVWLLFSGGVQGVLNANANSLAMMTLLALGTFVAGVQARVWRICAVGVVLFAAVPGLGWLDQWPLLWTVATLVIVALGGVAWWVMDRPAPIL